MTGTRWAEPALAELVEDAIGGLWGSPPASDKPDETDVLVVRGADFRQWETRRALDAAPRRVPSRSLARRQLSEGDLVLEVSGGSPAQPVGRAIVIDKRAIEDSPLPLICSNFCRKLRLKPGVDPFFVKHQLDWLYNSRHTDRFQTSTTNIRNLQVDDFLQGTRIVLPGHEQQVALSTLFDHIGDQRQVTLTHLDAARKAIERLRHSVLASACSGKLTASWRDQHPTLDARRSVAHAIRQVSAGAPKQLEPELIPPPTDEETPETWVWTTFGSVLGELRNGVSPAPAMEPPGIPILRISAVRAGTVDLNDLRFLRQESDDWSKFMLRDGDLLFTRYNGSIALLGVCGMVRDIRGRTVLYPDKLMRVRFDHDVVIPQYAELFFSGPRARARMISRSVSSAGQQGVSGATVKAQPFALPPVEEQEEIVRRVNELLAYAQLELSRIESASNRADRIMQSVLAKAFRGELVSNGKELGL